MSSDAMTVDVSAAMICVMHAAHARTRANLEPDEYERQNQAEIARGAEETARHLLSRHYNAPDFDTWLQEQKGRADAIGRLARGEEISIREFPELADLIVRLFPRGFQKPNKEEAQ